MAECIPLGGKKYRVRQFCRRDGSGKKVYCFDKTVAFDSVKDRNAYVRDIETKHEAGALHDDGSAGLTLGAFLERWLKHKKPHLDPNTHADYKENFDRYITEELLARPLASVKPIDIQELYDAILERGLSARAVRNFHMPLKQALKMAVWWDLIPSNPAERTERPKVRREPPEPLMPDEAPKFLEAARRDRLGAFFALMVSNGPRPEEAFGLKWEDVDLERGTVAVRRVLKSNREGGGWRLRDYPKTDAGVRTLKLAPMMAAALRAHRTAQLEERVAAGKRYKNHGLVFCTKTGEPLSLSNVVSRHLVPVLEAAGLRRVTLYDLRHTYATLSIAAGEEPKWVSAQLGHASVSFTLDVYVKLVDSLHAEASGKLESILYPEKKALVDK